MSQEIRISWLLGFLIDPFDPFPSPRGYPVFALSRSRVLHLSPPCLRASVLRLPPNYRCETMVKLMVPIRRIVKPYR
jgi:hypothetical protein